MPTKKKTNTAQSALFPTKKYRYIPQKGTVMVTRIKAGTPPEIRAAILESIKYLQ